MTAPAHELKETLRREAARLGFQLFGVAPAERLDEDIARLRESLARGDMAGMTSYMGDRPERRGDPQALLEGARSVVVVGMSVAQKPPDLVGTWEGEATLEGEAEPNVLTLVLELKEGELQGHMTDQFDTMFEAPISETNLEDGTFSFSVLLDAGGQSAEVLFTMKVDGDSMEGSLEIPDMGMPGTWEATKQK